jgi:hypothetical protein
VAAVNFGLREKVFASYFHDPSGVAVTFRNVLFVLLVAASARAQSDSSAILQGVSVVEEKAGVKVEIDLTSPVTPRVTLEANPDRLVMELADTVPNPQPAPIDVNKNGVTSVRVEIGGTSSAVLTRIVVYLSEARQYALTTDDGKIALHVLPIESASQKKHSGAVPAASAPVLGRLHRKQPQQPNAQGSNTSESASITPPHALPPISFPDEKSAAGKSGTTPTNGGTLQSSPSQTAPGLSAEASGTMPNPSSSDASTAPTQANPDVRMAFKVKYVAEGVVYLNGGSNDGLTEGMKLVVKQIDPGSKPTASKTEDAQPIADLQVASVAQASAVSEIRNSSQPVKVGDWAYLSSEDTQALSECHPQVSCGRRLH